MNISAKSEQYFKNGGEFFSVRAIEQYRDGGTIRVDIKYHHGDMPDRSIFFHRTERTAHNEWPNLVNRIKDDLFLAFLKERIERYRERAHDTARLLDIWCSEFKYE